MDIIHLSKITLNMYDEKLISKCISLYKDGFGHLDAFNEEKMREQLRCGDVSWFVLVLRREQGEMEPISAAVYYPRSPPFRLDTIWSLCTRRDMRGRGYARRLLEYIRAGTKETIFMKADTAALATFYRSMGFVSL